MLLINNNITTEYIILYNNVFMAKLTLNLWYNLKIEIIFKI